MQEKINLILTSVGSVGSKTSDISLLKIWYRGPGLETEAPPSVVTCASSSHAVTLFYFRVARCQNLVPSFPWIAPGWRACWRNPRKRRDQILQRSVAEPLSLKPEGSKAYHLKIRLSPSDNHTYLHLRRRPRTKSMPRRPSSSAAPS